MTCVTSNNDLTIENAYIKHVLRNKIGNKNPHVVSIKLLPNSLRNKSRQRILNTCS